MNNAPFENRNNLPDKLLKPYNPAETEPAIYKAWEDSGFFNPDVCVEKGVTKSDAKPFTIMMPPPNATGVLHMGHGLFLTIEDIMIRYKRMRGFKTLWLPGTDHASIATQSTVEKAIYKKEGLSRHDLGREELLNRIEKFVEENRSTMTSQMRIMGASCDWSREAFTMDAKRNLAVNTLFKKMYTDGLIYRGHRIVNWDPKGQTTISDDEIVYEERKSVLYTFKYSKDFPISISTTRPETKVGDVAVAVHPEDTRYQQYVGQTFEISDFCGVSLSIKIIADDSVEKDFGTGALGVTPAHSMIDWAIADRHNLTRPQVINEYAKMTVGDERILNKKTTDAREVIVAWLRDQGLLESEQETNQNIATAERTSGIVEPLPKLQWFIDVNKKIPGREHSLKEITRNPVADGSIKIIPDYMDKTYFHWINNLRDWCISRQIWYGHRIPVWYRNDEIFCGIEAPTEDGWEQDSDTLDTWFSSGAWTFSTLGWPENTPDLQTYHPTDVLETGKDIIFFWVARMILMTGYALETIPFHTVYFHGMVRNGQGEKMSKSLGNNLDPIDIAKRFGADAGRMALVVGTAPGTDSKIDENKIKAYSKFANKIWNATRFVLDNIADLDMNEPRMFDAEDQASQDELTTLLKEITQEMEDYKFYLVSEKLYHYFWHTFADVIIERSKKKIAENNSVSAKWLLYTQLTTLIKALHPFMPFVTEEVWNLLPKQGEPMTGTEKLLIIEAWPTSA
jgi:valyl-tRNA synthetase